MVDNYLDKEGKIFMLPRKKEVRKEVFKYLADTFEYDKIYTEKEVNDIIHENHSFNDTCLLRRELVEYKFLTRQDDGACYKKANIQ